MLDVVKPVLALIAVVLATLYASAAVGANPATTGNDTVPISSAPSSGGPDDCFQPPGASNDPAADGTSGAEAPNVATDPVSQRNVDPNCLPTNSTTSPSTSTSPSTRVTEPEPRTTSTPEVQVPGDGQQGDGDTPRNDSDPDDDSGEDNDSGSESESDSDSEGDSGSGPESEGKDDDQPAPATSAPERPAPATEAPARPEPTTASPASGAPSMANRADRERRCKPPQFVWDGNARGGIGRCGKKPDAAAPAPPAPAPARPVPAPAPPAPAPAPPAPAPNPLSPKWQKIQECGKQQGMEYDEGEDKCVPRGLF